MVTTAPHALLPLARRAVDGLLEVAVVPSFTRIGPAVRSRLDGWDPPTADLGGRVAIVTGSSRGIGHEIAVGLARCGATVWVTSRSRERADRAAADVARAAGVDDARVVAHAVDMGELDQVRAFADRLRAETAAIDVLVHNAGALTEQRHETSQGIEATVATHLVGPWLLTDLVADHLAEGARVVFMSSGGMYTQGLTLRGLEMGEHDYRGTIAYARAKRAQVVLVDRLADLLPAGVVVHAMHPGWAATDGVATSLPGFDAVMGPLLRSAPEAADTALWLATADEPGRSSGDFWHDRRRRSTHRLPTTRTDPARADELVGWLRERVARAEAG